MSLNGSDDNQIKPEPPNCTTAFPTSRIVPTPVRPIAVSIRFFSIAIRNGTEAVIHAEEACRLSGRKKATFIDTLAAAYAEKGDFTAAIQAQKEAIALVTPEGQTSPAGMQYRLELFESGRAVRSNYFAVAARWKIASGKYSEAEQNLTDALGSVKHLGERHPETRGCILAFIELYEAWDKPEKAKEWRAKLSQTETTEQ